MGDQQEFGMLLELLSAIEAELGISFSPEEQKKLGEFLKSNPNADPEKIMAAIIALIEKKLHAKLSLEKTKKLKDRCRQSKLLIAREKISPSLGLRKVTEPTEKVILIIRAIERKLFGLKKIKRELTEKERQKAVEDYQKNVKPNDSPIAKANVALLGVLSVGIAGGIQPTVRQSWGNLLNVPNYNPYHGLSAGGSSSDQAERINLSRPFALELQAILNVIHISNVDHSKIEKIMNSPAVTPAPQADEKPVGIDTKSTPIPIPTPFGNPLDPFK